jgi:hypothetical protein
MEQMVICRGLLRLAPYDVQEYASGQQVLTSHRHLSHFLHGAVHPILFASASYPLIRTGSVQQTSFDP